jgi:hypothetical protein
VKYGFGRQNPGLEQLQKYGGLYQLKQFSLDIWFSYRNTVVLMNK